LEVADNRAHELVGAGDLHQHERLQQDRTGLAHGFPEADRGCGLEGFYRRVHFVIGAVVEGGFDVHHREAGYDTGGEALFDAGFDTGHVLARDGAADDAVDELRSPSPGWDQPAARHRRTGHGRRSAG